MSESASLAAINPQPVTIELSDGTVLTMRKLQPLSGDHADVVHMQAGLLKLFESGTEVFGASDVSLGLYAQPSTREPVQRLVARSLGLTEAELLALDETDQLELLYTWVGVNDRFFVQTLPKLMSTLAGLMTKLGATLKSSQSLQKLSTGSASSSS